MDYSDEIHSLFDGFEKDGLTQNEIIDNFIKLAKSHNLDNEFMWDLNNVTKQRGYSFWFVIKPLDRKKFNSEEYWKLASNASKSLNKTKALINYLLEVKDHRLSICTMSMLKVKYLLDLELLPKYSTYINEHKDYSLRDLLFSSYNNEDSTFQKIIEMLHKIGINDASYTYMLFKFDVEYLLWSIEQKSRSKPYLKTNTIRLAFNLAPKEYFINNKKAYYENNVSQYAKKYLKQIDKEKIKEVKSRFSTDGNPKDGTGYQVLYQYLMNESA